MYIQLRNGFVQFGQSTIPPDLANQDYQTYLAWLAAGNSPELEPPPSATPNEQYQGFYSDLLGEYITLFWFVRSIADSDLAVSNAYTDLMGAIGFQRLDGFQSSITILFASLQSCGNPFSASQIAAMRQLLDKNGFEEVEFPLGS